MPFGCLLGALWVPFGCLGDVFGILWVNFGSLGGRFAKVVPPCPTMSYHILPFPFPVSLQEHYSFFMQSKPIFPYFSFNSFILPDLLLVIPSISKVDLLAQI